MSRAALERFLFCFDKEPARQDAFAQGRADAFAGFELDAAEHAVLRDKDLATLFQWGIHPLLIRNFAGTLGLKYTEAYAARGILP